MIPRRARTAVERMLRLEAAAGLIGPRQSGKTTLALDIATSCDAVYLDLERREDRAALAQPARFLGGHEDRLVILDEIHHTPELFPELRGIIDAGRRRGRGLGRFLILGSASIPRLRQSESLAGRIGWVELGPLSLLELGPGASGALWVRGGLPRSFLAESDQDSFTIRRNFLQTFLARDVPHFAPRMPIETTDRLWTMLAHGQGTMLNLSRLAGSLGVSAPAVGRHVDLLADLLLVRRLPPYLPNVRKRLVKSPRLYLRDSGLVHALLGIPDRDALLRHPVVGASWEGFVVETLLAAAPEGTNAFFYRTARGAEVDLVLHLPGRSDPWVVEIRLGSAPSLTRGFHLACEDIGPERSFVVHGGSRRYPLPGGPEAIPLRELTELLAGLVA